MNSFKPYATLGLIAAAIATLTACGGGGGSDADSTPATPAATTAVTTTVMDGLIHNALVCVDSNNDGACQTAETQGRTNASGQVTLSIPTADLGTAKLVAMIGTDAIDADTGPVLTAYTLKTAAGKHTVISPLTNMVQTKIDIDKASGTVTSTAAAEAYVQTQTNLTVSVFDNFIAKRDTDANYKKAGEVARLLVVSTQESKKAAASTRTCATSTTEDDDNTKESRIDSDLSTRLTEIRTLSDTIAKACTSTNSVKDCDSDYKSHARIVSSCAAPAPVAQTITFAALANMALGTAAPALSATSTSGLAVTFASTTPGVCTVNGTALTWVTAGTCTVSANQPGNTSYTAAAQVLRTFTVAAASGSTTTTVVAPTDPTAQTITFAMPANQTMGTATPALVATSSSGLAVTLASSTPSVCAVNGTALTLVAAGTCTVTATQAGNASYASAAAIAHSFSVAAAATVGISAANGKVVYNTPFNGASCASCHSAMPALNLGKVLSGANSANTILNAINTNKGGMRILSGAISTSQLNDIAAYLATPNL